MTDSPQSRFRLPHWGWFLLATVVLVVGFVGLSVWLPYNPKPQEGSPIIMAALGISLAAFGVWLTVRLVNRGQKPWARTCVFVMLVVGVCALSVWSSIWLPYDREQQVVKKIESCGGYASFGTHGPEWLRWLVGDESLSMVMFFDMIGAVHLEHTTIRDAEVAHLSGLTNLWGLHLEGTAVTDAGLAHLNRLTKLYELYLDGTLVTDAGLPHLTRMAKLEVLSLKGTAVTATGIEKLKIAFPNCDIRH